MSERRSADGGRAKSAVDPCGVLVIDKAPGPTSFDVVQRVRRRFGLRRVGHGGTLDPFASGVLPVCLGEATKLLPYLLGADKEYEAEVRLGIETDTCDHTGQTVHAHEGPPPSWSTTGASVERALDRFRGTFEQMPPAYAAIKVAGRPLYDYARHGEEVPRSPRQVTVHVLTLVSFEWPFVRLFVRCSKGTYIRSLAHDLGEALGVGGHLTSLRRVRSGPFSLESALPSGELDSRGTEGPPSASLIGLAEALAHLPTRILDAAEARAIEQGKRVPCDLDGLKTGDFLRLLRQDGSLLAVGIAEGSADAAEGRAVPDRLKPERVFLDSRAERPSMPLNLSTIG